MYHEMHIYENSVIIFILYMKKSWLVFPGSVLAGPQRFGVAK